MIRSGGEEAKEVAGCCAPGTAGREEDRARVPPGSRGSSGALGARGGGGGRGPPGREGGAGAGARRAGWSPAARGCPGMALGRAGRARGRPPGSRAGGAGQHLGPPGRSGVRRRCARKGESGAVLFAGFQATEKRFFPLRSIFAIV